MNEMPRPSSSRLFQSVGLAIMGILVFLACWRMTAYVGLQNRNLTGAIETGRAQIAQGLPVAQNYEKFLASLVEYLKATRDQNILVIMRQSGVPFRVEEPGQSAPAAPAAGAAPSGGQAGGAQQPPAKR